MRKEITARAVRNNKIQILEVDIDTNIRKVYDVDKEINRIQKATSRRKQKNQDYREISLRLNELLNSKIGIGNTIDALEQTISHVEEVKDQIKLRLNN